MPIQISSQDTNYSFAHAVNYVQDKYSVGTIRTAASAALTVAALVEVVAKAVLTAISLAAYPFNEKPFNESKAALMLACSTVKEAAIGVFGYSTPLPIVAAVPEEVVSETIEQAVVEEPAPVEVSKGISKWQVAVASVLIVGGLSVAAYLAYSYRKQIPRFKIPRQFPRAFQSMMLTNEQKLANCIIESEGKWRINSAFAALDCYRTQDPSVPLVETFGEDAICQKIKKPFRALALLVHPDKALPEDKDLFQNAMRILGEAKDKIERRFCSEEAEIAKCVLKGRYADVVLKCAGEEIPKSCPNLETHVHNLITKIEKAYSDHEDLLIQKIKEAYQKTSCYSVPAFIVNWFS